MKIIESPVKAPPASNASPILINLILWLLQKDPRLRPSIRDVLKEVEVRKRLRDEGLELPEEVMDEESTNFLVEGLPVQLPKELEEKASTMEDDGTISLMTTLVDDKDAAHRSFRVAAAALSAQKSNNRMPTGGPDPLAANSDTTLLSNNINKSNVEAPMQRAPSGRIVPTNNANTAAAPTDTATAGPVKRTVGSRSNSNITASTTSTAAPYSGSSNTNVSSTTPSVAGNRVRGKGGRGVKGRVTSEKVKTH